MNQILVSDERTRVLIVDDDVALRGTISDYLSRQGVETFLAEGQKGMQAVLEAHPVSLVLLDLQLGQEDGLDLLRELRRARDLPVIIVTGHRQDELDRVLGLELGADDYMVKPFSLRELLARVRTVLRRSEASMQAVERETPSQRQRFDGWLLDRRARRLTSPVGAIVELTKSEFALLCAFLDAPGRPLSREFLLQATRMHEDIFDRSIDVQILRLRRKLEENASNPRLIKTERGVGYIFTPKVTSS